MVEFYDLKQKKKVNIPESNVKLIKMNNRHMLVGDFKGRKLYKFVSEKNVEKSNLK
jgi:hypothetical protein